jgi:hypothetical protein
MSGPSSDAITSILTALFLFVEIKHLNKLHVEDMNVEDKDIII